MTDEERQVYERRLREAREKRHLILVGEGVEQFVDQNGESVKYSRANLTALDRYIAELEGILNPALAFQRQARPLRFTF